MEANASSEKDEVVNYAHTYDEKLIQGLTWAAHMVALFFISFLAHVLLKTLNPAS